MKRLKYSIEYDKPQKYLVEGAQTQFIFSNEELQSVKREIGELKTDKDLFNIINFIYGNKIKPKTKFENGAKFNRTAKEIFASREYTGCSDYAIVFSAVAKQLNIPTVCIATANLDWIEEVENGNTTGVVRGHDTCECFINDKWVHVDVANRYIDGIYDKDSLIVKYGNEKKRKVFWKGVDFFEMKKRSTEKRVDLMRRLVLEDRKPKPIKKPEIKV